jgi:anti-sigma factor RsiW
MDDSKARTDETAAWVTMDAHCTNEDIGNLLGDYLFNTLTPEDRAVFEVHLVQCVACFTAVTNWANISPAVKNQPSSTGNDQIKKARSFKAGT